MLDEGIVGLAEPLELRSRVRISRILVRVGLERELDAPSEGQRQRSTFKPAMTRASHLLVGRLDHLEGRVLECAGVTRLG